MTLWELRVSGIKKKIKKAANGEAQFTCRSSEDSPSSLAAGITSRPHHNPSVWPFSAARPQLPQGPFFFFGSGLVMSC